MEIRKICNGDDVEAIGNIYARSWKTAYRGIVPQRYLDELTGGHWSNFLADSAYDSFVILDGGKYVGTSSVCPARDAAMAGWGELVSIYLLPDYFGKGYAKPLLDCSINALASAGFQDIYLWVLSENSRAKQFYEKHGFWPNGDTVTVAIEGKELIEKRYVKRF